MKILGIILLIAGAIGLVVTGINYANQTDQLNLLGLKVTLSQGSILPIIIAGLVLVVGIILSVSKQH